MPALTIKDLVVEYSSGGYAVRPIDGLSSSIEPGELVLLLGPSGCGKTTLLSCIGGILTPTDGTIRFGDITSPGSTAPTLTRVPPPHRRHRVPGVQPACRASPRSENVEVPLRAAKVGPERAPGPATELLEQVGLAERITTARATCRAGSSSGSRSRVRSRSTRRCCSPTSRPRTSTTSRSRRCSGCCATSRRGSGSS